MVSEADIRRIIGRIVETSQPVAVGIFGSYAIDRAHENSDLDILVIQNSVLAPHARRHSIRRCLFGILHPLDIQVFTAEEFESEAREEYSFAWVIAKQVKIYYWSQAATQSLPSLDCAPRLSLTD